MKDTLIQYLRRDQKGSPYAAFVAVAVGNCVGVGWSRCSSKDSFSKAKAVLIAENRARKLAAGGKVSQVHRDLAAEYNLFFARCTKYFADKSVLVCAVSC